MRLAAALLHARRSTSPPFNTMFDQGTNTTHSSSQKACHRALLEYRQSILAHFQRSATLADALVLVQEEVIVVPRGWPKKNSSKYRLYPEPRPARGLRSKTLHPETPHVFRCFAAQAARTSVAHPLKVCCIVRYPLGVCRMSGI